MNFKFYGDPRNKKVNSEVQSLQNWEYDFALEYLINTKKARLMCSSIKLKVRLKVKPASFCKVQSNILLC